MKIQQKNASIFIYILLLVNINLIIWYIVFNNVFVLNNNINIWKNSEEVFSNINDKWLININTVRKYNSNWWNTIDAISCPTNVTMSWTTSSGSSIVTNMVYNLWSIYCSWDYNWEEFRIYFDNNFNDFTRAYYSWSIVDIVKSSATNIYLDSNNITPTSTITWTASWNWHIASHSADNNINTWFESNNKSFEYLNYQFSSNKSIWWITIKKPSHNWWKYWNNWKIYLYDSTWNQLDKINIHSMKKKTYKDIDLKYRWLTKDVRSVKITVNNKWLDIKEFEMYELKSTWWEEVWKWNTVFNDSDNTLISFTSDWIWWWDNIDDDFDSDNYRVTSIGDTYYANWYQDDDVVPRLTIFWNVKKTDWYYNIFWNNYKTNDFVDKNTNNDDILNIKIWDVDNWYLFIDLFTVTWNINYNMKVLEFDRDAYKNKFTLLPLNITEWLSLTGSLGYLQNNSWSLSLSSVKTGNEYKFDFKNKDYWIFIINNNDTNLSYRLRWETSTWTMIYINPINDSQTWVIESLSNHIIIWWEKNFIWENFTIVWDK